MPTPKVAIVYYSMYGHIATMAKAEQEGLKKAGIEADLFQVSETLPQEVLAKMGAPGADPNIPTITADKLEEYDAYLFGVPTRFGNFPAQWKTFWDTTGKQWSTGGYWGKYAGLFVSTGTQGGGQESTALSAMSTLAHHGLLYVPLGYKVAFGQLASFEEIHGGSAWGAGTFSGADGSHGHANAKPKEKKEEAKTKKENIKTTGGDQDETETKGGPCGLPSKCSIL